MRIIKKGDTSIGKPPWVGIMLTCPTCGCVFCPEATDEPYHAEWIPEIQFRCPTCTDMVKIIGRRAENSKEYIKRREKLRKS